MTAKYINGIDVSKIIFYVQEQEKFERGGQDSYRPIVRVVLLEGHNVVFYLNEKSFTSYLVELVNGDKTSVHIECGVRYYVNRNRKA